MDGVGSKAVAKKSTITNVFDKFKKVNGNGKAVGKFSFQKERFIADDTSSEDEEEESEGSMKDFIDDQSSDEFDDMTKGEKSSMEAKKTKIFETMKSSSDDDSEDEDFKKMSTEEQMLAMIPRSLDGVCDIDDLDESDSEEEDDRERFFLLFFFFSFFLFFSFLCLDDFDLFLSSPRQGQGYIHILAKIAEFSQP